jgi:hypothetical protein
VFFLLLWKMALESVLKKNSFHTRFFFSLLDDNKGYISVSIPEKCTFFYLFLIFRDRTRHREESIHKSKRVET